MTDSLFPDIEPTATVAGETLSAGRRLTIRQRANVDRGIHPLTRTPIDQDPEHTCGTCRFRAAGQYPKCLWPDPDKPISHRHHPRFTSGPATDVRAWWPGCTDWEAKP